MSPLKRSNNIAARMGRWSARHWKTAVFGWLAFVVASFYVGNFLVGTKQINEADTNVGQAQKADRIIKAAGFADQPRRFTANAMTPTKMGSPALPCTSVSPVTAS